MRSSEDELGLYAPTQVVPVRDVAGGVLRAVVVDLAEVRLQLEVVLGEVPADGTDELVLEGRLADAVGELDDALLVRGDLRVAAGDLKLLRDDEVAGLCVVALAVEVAGRQHERRLRRRADEGRVVEAEEVLEVEVDADPAGGEI